MTADDTTPAGDAEQAGGLTDAEVDDYASFWWAQQTGETDRWEDLDPDEREAVVENSYAGTVADWLAARAAADTGHQATAPEPHKGGERDTAEGPAPNGSGAELRPRSAVEYRLAPDGGDEPTVWRYDGPDDPRPLAIATKHGTHPEAWCLILAAVIHTRGACGQVPPWPHGPTEEA